MNYRTEDVFKTLETPFYYFSDFHIDKQIYTLHHCLLHVR